MTRRLAGAAITWLVVLGVVGVAVHPERCPAVTAPEVRSSAELAVGWFAANLNADGSFVYRYDRVRSVQETGYNDTRHAGVLLSLYQAESAGVSGAADIADLGLGYVDDRTGETQWGTVFGRGSTLSTGAIALLVAALDERRTALATTDRDDLLLALGDTLIGTITEDGAVNALIDRATGPVAGTRDRFFTGEVLWALSRLELGFPDRGYGAAALAVRRYLVEDRDAIERPFPQVSDHWGAYAWETMSRWPDPPEIGDTESSWLVRQLGLFGLQVRYESQRVGGLTTFTRGSHALASGVGTLGEGIGSFLAVDERAQFMSLDDRADLIDRARCTAGLLVDRQITRDEATTDADPAAVVGAWFRKGDTQMDDQQHALSALLLLENRLEG